VDIGVAALALMTVHELAVVSVGTTVAFVVIACRHVVRIIAESVTQALVNASRPLEGGVHTSAVFAVFGIHGFPAAITTIPAARILVIAVITMVVTLVDWQRTSTLAGGAGGIKTLARFAVQKLFVVFLFEFAAITAIPIAMLLVVLVVAVAITLALGNITLVQGLFAVAAVARAPEDARESFTLDSEFSFPLGASSFKAQVRCAFLLFFVDFALAASTIAFVVFFQIFARVRRFFEPVVACLSTARGWARRLFFTAATLNETCSKHRRNLDKRLEVYANIRTRTAGGARNFFLRSKVWTDCRSSSCLMAAATGMDKIHSCFFVRSRLIQG